MSTVYCGESSEFESCESSEFSESSIVSPVSLVSPVGLVSPVSLVMYCSHKWQLMIHYSIHYVA